MSRNVRDLVGTPDGFCTVEVASGNPKTPCGINTFVFRRNPVASLRKLQWAAVIDGRGAVLPENIPLGDKSVAYTPEEKTALRQFVIAVANGQKGPLENADFGRITIGRDFVKEVQIHAVSTKREVASLSFAREIAAAMVHYAASPNEETGRHNGILYFEYGFAKLRLDDGLYLVMGEVGSRRNSLPYYDQRVVAKFKANSEAPPMHGQLRFGESAFDEIYDSRFRLIMQGGSLCLNGCGPVRHVGLVQAVDFVRALAAHGSVVLVSGNASYEHCGAAEFLGRCRAAESAGSEWLHLRVRSANPKIGEVQSLLDGLQNRSITAFIAVGGGTVIDTAKLLNLAVSCETDAWSLPNLKDCPSSLFPLLAIPTTDGTGAETTRFAVCYDGETKYSIDFPQLRPSHVLLLPQFAVSLPPYQRESVRFDAYAQAVESLWAKGATDESRMYARKALDLMASGQQMLGSYWAGRAIDISRTTAAHALSYYMTSHYGIPHGHAVYMMFPYVCRANGHPEYIRIVPELQTLRDFAADHGLVWSDLVATLLSNVNLPRLANNPAPITVAAFGVV